jgi:hypothetical protein
MLSRTPRRFVPWSVVGAALVIGAFAVRLLLIQRFPFGGYQAHFEGGTDVHYYYYYADLMLKGFDPWKPPPGPMPYALDIPALEMYLFAGVLSIKHATSALRFCFALADATTIFLIVAFFPRPRWWRFSVASFVAFNPFVLVAWTVFAEDKTLHFLGVTLILLLIGRGRPGAATIFAALYAAAKWVSLFFGPPLLVHLVKLRGWRAWPAIVAAAAIFLIAQIPYFPSPLLAYLRKNNRLDMLPQHASVSEMLVWLHIYGPWVPRVFIVVSLVAIYYFYWRNRLSIEEAIVLSIYCFFVSLPDESLDRVVLIFLPFLFIVRLSPWRLAIIWLATGLSAAGNFTPFWVVPHFVPASREFAIWVGAYGSPVYVALTNIPTVLFPLLWLLDRFRNRRAPESAPSRSSASTPKVAGA